MRKTLYLYDYDDTSIKQDGPSILVQKNGRATYRIPYEYVDFVYVNYSCGIPQDVLLDFVHFKRPIVISGANLRESLHIIPYYDSGYFHEVTMKIIRENPINREKFYRFLLQLEKEVRIRALAAIDRNLGLCFKTRYLDTKTYEYYIRKHAKANIDRLFVLKRHLKDLYMALINNFCIQFHYNVNSGIINHNRKLGFCIDIYTPLDAITDVIGLKFFDYKQKKLWCGKKELSESGFKLIATLFEKSKSTVSNLVLRILVRVSKFK